MSKDTKKQYLLDDSERDAPPDDYLAYNNLASGADSTERRAKQKKWIIGGVVVTLALAVLVGVIVWGMASSGSNDKPGSSNDTTPVWQQWRLPPNVRPSSYNLTLRIDLDRFTFSGQSTVAVSISDHNMSAIVLHSLYLTIDACQVQLVDGSIAPTNHWLVNQTENSYQYLVIQGKDGWVFPVTPLLYITTNFHRDLPTNTSSGLYATSYNISATSPPVWVAATQFEPTHSRRAFPNFDELQMKAVFNVTMEVKQGLVALTNARQVSNYSIDGGFQRFIFSPTDVRQSSYLMAFAVANYTSVLAAGSGQPGGYPFRCWGRADLINEAQWYCDRAFKVQEFFHNLLGQKFPLQKQDQIAIPNKGGAMENYGLVTYMTTGIYLNADTTSSVYQGAINVNAHELAHMLWGDLFTPLWWSDTWTKEGSATFWSFVGMQAIMGDQSDWHSDAQAVAGYMEAAMRNDVLLSTVPLVYGCNTPSEVAARFQGPTYNKGGSLLRMIRGILGEANFYTGASQFLQKYSTSNALSIDYFDVLAQNTQNAPSNPTSVNITDVFWQWASQSGYPLITAAPSNGPQGKRVWALSQSQYHLPQNPQGSQVWPVWVQYVYDSVAEGQAFGGVWLTSANGYKQDVTVPDDVRYLKLNFNRTGFYRVLYPLPVYTEFQTALTRNVSAWTQQDRIALLLDTYQMQMDGYLKSWPTVLNSTLFLQNERAYPVWNAGAYILTDLWSRLRFAIQTSFPAVQNWQRYVRSLTANASSELLWRQVTTEHLQGMMQQTLTPLVCRVNGTVCLPQAQALYQQWQTTSVLPPANLRPIVFGYGSPTSDFDALIARSVSEPNVAYSDFYLNGAIQAADQYTLVKLLTGAQDTPTQYLRPGLTWSTLLTRVVALNDEGLYAGMQWLGQPNRFASLAAQLDVDATRGQLIQVVNALVASQQWQEDLNKVTAVMQPLVSSLNNVVQLRYDEAMALALAQINWVDVNWQHINEWLTTAFL